MSTRCTIKDPRDEAIGKGFHLYEDLADERDCAILDLGGLMFETLVSFAPSSGPEKRVVVRIHNRFARSLGLIPNNGKS
jgi:hypothetical protein